MHLRAWALAAFAILSVLGCASRDDASGAASPAAPPRVALVIGNADYDNAPRLKNPVNDADEMCRALQRMNYRALCHRNVRDRAEFDAHVREYLQLLGPRTLGVVYFSGHGVQVRGANYLIPTQASPRSAAEDPTRVLYGLQELFDRLRERPSRLQLVVLDACRSDLFSSNRSAASRSLLLRTLEAIPRVSGVFVPITDAPPGTAVLYATAAGDTAFDGVGRHGPMTEVLLGQIGTRGQKLNELLDEVKRRVPVETERVYRKRMTPFTYGAYDGALCLGGCVQPFVDGAR